MIKPKSCDGCPLASISQSFSVPEGNASLGVWIVGDHLAQYDAIEGKPFSRKSPAGSLLDQVIQRLGYTRKQFGWTNLIQCLPPGAKLEYASYEKDAIGHCSANFVRNIGGENSHNTNRVILALGNLALKNLTGASGSEKEKQSIRYLSGFVMQGRYGLVVPVFHPRMIRQGAMKYTGLLTRYVQRAVDVAQGRWNEHRYHNNYIQPKFDTSPSLHDAITFALQIKDNPGLRVAYDIETPHSQEKDSGDKGQTITLSETLADNEFSYDPGVVEIVEGRDEEEDELKNVDDDSGRIITIQFSTDKGSAICFPWEDNYIRVAKKILSYPNTKLNWNGWHFDNPRIIRNNASIGGINIDLMWKWHHAQPDLDRNLQFAASYCGYPFPWKHLYGKAMNYYGCADVASLHWIDEVITEEMARMRILAGWERYVQNLYTGILAPMVGRGYPINTVKRKIVGDWLDKESERLWKEMQERVPIESGIRNVGPKRKVEMN